MQLARMEQLEDTIGTLDERIDEKLVPYQEPIVDFSRSRGSIASAPP